MHWLKVERLISHLVLGELHGGGVHVDEEALAGGRAHDGEGASLPGPCDASHRRADLEHRQSAATRLGPNTNLQEARQKKKEGGTKKTKKTPRARRGPGEGQGYIILIDKALRAGGEKVALKHNALSK